MTLSKVLTLIAGIADLRSVDFDYVGGDFFLEIFSPSEKEKSAINRVIAMFACLTQGEKDADAFIGKPFDYAFEYEDGSVNFRFNHPEERKDCDYEDYEDEDYEDEDYDCEDYDNEDYDDEDYT